MFDVSRFQQHEKCRVAMLSIINTDTGLKLMAASIAVFADLYGTPAQTLQAEDRMRRIGQAKAIPLPTCSAEARSTISSGLRAKLP
jgi:SNF2 family DNA or RNA helicase